MMSDSDFSKLSNELQEKREQKFSTDLFQSEYNRIIMWCYNFATAVIETPPYDKMGIMRRNRIFQYITRLAEMREDIPTVEEYFGDQKIGLSEGTITTTMAMTYVSMVQDKVMQMNDFRIETEPIEGD